MWCLAAYVLVAACFAYRVKRDVPPVSRKDWISYCTLVAFWPAFVLYLFGWAFYASLAINRFPSFEEWKAQDGDPHA